MQSLSASNAACVSTLAYSHLRHPLLSLGNSQVLQGVVARSSRRMTMRDKAKDKTLAAREQQVNEMRVEAEQVSSC